jgi:hypothetical protein
MKQTDQHLDYKAIKLVFALFSLLAAASAQEICFTNHTVSFTNLEGKSFQAVQLTTADRDGVIWRLDASGGRVCYTNLHPDLLEAWGIPTNRIAEALRRAEKRTAWNARDRARQQAAALASSIETQTRQQAEIAADARRRLLDHKQAEVQAIERLANEIEQAKVLFRRAQAATRDFNNANRYDRLAPTLYVKDTERVKIEEAEKRLKRMKQDFSLKYRERVR